MLTSVIACTYNTWNSTVNKLEELYFNDYDEFRIQGIEGLGPVKADISTLSTPMDSGGVYLSSRDGMRNIVLTVGLFPDYQSGSTVSSLRERLLAVMYPKRLVELQFYKDDGECYKISGHVETHEPTLFDPNPMVQVSIICEDPYFDRVGETQTIVPVMEDGTNTFIINYDGFVDVGFVFEFNVTSVTTMDLWILQKLPRTLSNSFGINSFRFQAGDTVRLSSVKGDRYAKYVRSSATYSILGYLTGNLTQVKLTNGANAFTLTKSGVIHNALVKYTKRYGSL